MKRKSKPRQNPRTKITKIAFRDQDRLLQREMARAKKRYDFESAALALSDWTGRGHEEMRANGLLLIAEEVRNGFKDARESLKWLLGLNRRLGVWCACAVAREALKYVPKGEMRPLRAIETTEEWVRGRATKKQVRVAAASVDAVRTALASDNTDHAIDYAYFAAYYAAYVSYSVDKNLAAAAAYVAYSVASAAAHYADYGYAFADELRRLVDVVAEAVMTFPARSRSNPTRRRKR